jgi:hypothetical protein
MGGVGDGNVEILGDGQSTIGAVLARQPTDARARQYSGPSLGVAGICYSRLLHGARPPDETRVLGQGFTNKTAACVTDESKRARSLGARHHCASQGLWAKTWATVGCLPTTTTSASVMTTPRRRGVQDE